MKFDKPAVYAHNFFWLFLTYLLAPYFYFLIFLRRKRKSDKFKILIIQTAKMGDMVCTTPVFREIKKKFPGAHLTALAIAKAAGILKNNPWINEMVLITDYPGISGRFRLLSRLRKEKYNWVFNLIPDSFTNIVSFWGLVPHRATTTYKYAGEITELLSVFSNYRLAFRKHTLLAAHYLALLKFIGIENPSDEKEIFIKPAEEKKAADFLREKNLKGEDLLIGISVVPGNKLQAWDLINFAKLADLLIEKLKAKIIFTGTSDNQSAIEEVQKMMQNDSINSAGRFELHELPALLKKLKLFINVDSGSLYVADAVGTPVVDIIGPWDFREQAPSGKRVKLIKKDLDCFPCSFVIATPRFCKEGHHQCVKDVTPEEVFKAAVSLLHA